jgi:hypothetical protein
MTRFLRGQAVVGSLTLSETRLLLRHCQGNLERRVLPSFYRLYPTRPDGRQRKKNEVPLDSTHVIGSQSPMFAGIDFRQSDGLEIGDVDVAQPGADEG